MHAFKAVTMCIPPMRRGGMVFTFLAARGHAVGASLVERDAIGTARKLEAAAKARGVQLLLPTDVVVADAFRADADARVVPATAIPEGWMVRMQCMHVCHPPAEPRATDVSLYHVHHHPDVLRCSS